MKSRISLRVVLGIAWDLGTTFLATSVDFGLDLRALFFFLVDLSAFSLACKESLRSLCWRSEWPAADWRGGSVVGMVGGSTSSDSSSEVIVRFRLRVGFSGEENEESGGVGGSSLSESLMS